MEIDVTPLTGYILEILFAVITVVVGYGVTLLKDKLNVDKTSQFNRILDDSINAGLNYAFHRLEQQNKKLTFSTEKEAIAVATNYISSRTPGIMKHFNLTDERIAEMVESRLAGNVQKDEES